MTNTITNTMHEYPVVKICTGRSWWQYSTALSNFYHLHLTVLCFVIYSTNLFIYLVVCRIYLKGQQLSKNIGHITSFTTCLLYKTNQISDATYKRDMKNNSNSKEKLHSLELEIEWIHLKISLWAYTLIIYKHNQKPISTLKSRKIYRGFLKILIFRVSLTRTHLQSETQNINILTKPP